jgi:hypothetical protein
LIPQPENGARDRGISYRLDRALASFEP